MADARITLTLVGVPAGAETCGDCPWQRRKSTFDGSRYTFCDAFADDRGASREVTDGVRLPECRAAEEPAPAPSARRSLVPQQRVPVLASPEPLLPATIEPAPAPVLPTCPTCSAPAAAAVEADEAWCRPCRRWWRVATGELLPAPAVTVPATLPERCGDCRHFFGERGAVAGICEHPSVDETWEMDARDAPPTDCPLRPKETP